MCCSKVQTSTTRHRFHSFWIAASKLTQESPLLFFTVKLQVSHVTLVPLLPITVAASNCALLSLCFLPNTSVCLWSSCSSCRNLSLLLPNPLPNFLRFLYFRAHHPLFTLLSRISPTLNLLLQCILLLLKVINFLHQILLLFRHSNPISLQLEDFHSTLLSLHIRQLAPVLLHDHHCLPPLLPLPHLTTAVVPSLPLVFAATALSSRCASALLIQREATHFPLASLPQCLLPHSRPTGIAAATISASSNYHTFYLLYLLSYHHTF